MATNYNPYDANRAMALPFQQAEAQQRKADRQAAQPRGKRAHPERLKAIAAEKRRPRVRVEPASDELRRVLRHPNGMGFRSEGSVEWPMDRFTRRRLAEGSIKVVEQAEGRNERQQQNARRERAAPQSKSE